MGRTQEGQLRWLGPEKGVIHMAAGAILNAVWDLWARIENKPLWELVCDLEPEALVKLIDFKHIDAVYTPCFYHGTVLCLVHGLSVCHEISFTFLLL